ncbi:MAG: amidohydrolase family protein [Planctomycetota bacterium]
MTRSLGLTVILLALAATAATQSGPGLAIVNARLLPISGPAIERGTLLVRDGRIEKLGADVTAPPGYRTIDAQGGTLMPGVVNAHAHTGLTQAAAPSEPRPNRFRRGGRRRGGSRGGPAGNAENKSDEKVLDHLYARQDVFADVLRDGVTTLGLAPTGRGLPGQGAVVRPKGDDVKAMTVVESAFLSFAPIADTKTKDLIRKAIEDGKRASERRKRRQAAKEEAPADAGEGPPKEKPEGETPPPDKPAEPGKEPAKEAPGKEAPAGEGPRGRGGRSQQEPDPGEEAMADLLDGKTRAFVQLDSAMDFAHWEDVSQDASFTTVVVSRRHATSGSEGALELVLERLKSRKCTVLMSPDFDTVPNTQYVVNLAARLHAGGIEVGFLLPDQGHPLRTTRPQLIELVRAGLPAEVALSGITLTPAKALGVDQQVGSLEPGKAANLILWSSDPLDPVAQLRGVWLEGNEIEDDAR